MFESVSRGETDLIIARHSDNVGSLYQERLFTEPFVWVLRAKHPIAGKRLSFEKLASLSHAVIRLRNLADQSDPMRKMFGLTDEIDLGAFRRELLKRGLRQEIGMIGAGHAIRA